MKNKGVWLAIFNALVGMIFYSVFGMNMAVLYLLVVIAGIMIMNESDKEE